MSKNLLLLAPLLLTMGCFEKDSDADGLLDSEEEELGTDPEKADTDGDGIDDPDEIELGTDPTSADTDGDGLEDGAEVEDFGTDPILGDTDADGIADGDEVGFESDPLNRFSWPGDGVWPDMTSTAAADGVEGSDYGMGEVFPDFSATDRYGESVSLYQFYGEVILLDFSAGWCGPCKSVAQGAEEMWNEYRDDGFVIVHMMTDDYRGTGSADQDFLNDWADAYDLTFPVLGEGDIEGIYYDLYYAGLNEGYIPYMILLNQNMELEEIYVGGGNESKIASKVEDLLGL